MIFRREQETDTQVVQRLTRSVGIHIEIDTEGGQQVRRTGFTGDAAIAVFSHLQAARRRNKCAGSRDINAVAAVAAGTDNIGEQIVRAREGRGIFQQGGCRTGNLIRMLTANLHANQSGSQLFRLQFTAHDGGEQLVAFLLTQGLRLIQLFKNRLQRIGRLQLLLRPGQRLFEQACALGGQNGFRMEL